MLKTKQINSVHVVVVVINAAVQCFCACTILESKLEITNLETIYIGTVGIRLKENFYQNHGNLNY